MQRRTRLGALAAALLAAVGLPIRAGAQDPDSATYRVTFEGKWNTSSTPGGVVSGAHFTTLIGAVHNANVTFWSSGGTASAGVEQVAEIGGTSGFESEYNAVPAANRKALIKQGGTGATGSTTFTVEATKTHPLVTLLSMIGPSPDWFVGVSGLSLRDGQGWRATFSQDLFPYDAGTEDGTEFTPSNPATDPQGTIASIKGTGKFSNSPMATLTFALQTNRPRPPPDDDDDDGNDDNDDGGGDGGGDDDSDDDGEAPDPAAPCARHVAPYWHGEAVLILRSANGMSVGVETTCGGATATSAEFGQTIVREASCKDEDGAPRVGSLAVTGAAPGGWYYVRGNRNVAVAPLMCASHFEGETVEAATVGGTMTTRSDNGAFVRHDATRLIGIVPDLPAGGTGSLRAPYWRGWGGVVGKAVDGESVEVDYGCEIVPTRERLEADPETGVVSALLRPASCKSEDGRLFVGELKVTGMEDGGWYWLSGPSGGPPAVAPLVRSSLLDEEVQPVDPGNPNVTIQRGRNGTLFEHAKAALAGVVPHLED